MPYETKYTGTNAGVEDPDTGRFGRMFCPRRNAEILQVLIQRHAVIATVGMGGGMG